MIKTLGFYHARPGLQAASRSWTARFRSAAFAILAACALLPSRAAADDARVTRLLQAFDELSLWHDGKTLVPTRRWIATLRLQIVGKPGGSYEQFVVETLESFAKLAGLRLERAAEGGTDANLIVRFEQTSNYFVGGRAAGCYASTRWNGRGEIVRAELFVNYSMASQLRQCIVHEAMHAFGFPGHPHTLDSVLSYVYRRDALTELDQSAFRTLYDRRMRPNLYYLPALQLARQIIAEETKAIAPGAPPAGLGDAYLQKAVAYLREAAEAGQPMAQRQLGIAHYYAQVVPRDEPAAVGWWRKAAALGDIESRYLTGEALVAGRGAPKDVSAAFTEHLHAAERGHPGAMLRVARALETGDGAATDPRGAAMWYALAAQRGQAAATAPRDQIMGRLDSAGRAEVETRLRSWRPAQ